jgi:hypothetical protein
MGRRSCGEDFLEKTQGRSQPSRGHTHIVEVFRVDPQPGARLVPKKPPRLLAEHVVGEVEKLNL